MFLITYWLLIIVCLNPTLCCPQWKTESYPCPLVSGVQVMHLLRDFVNNVSSFSCFSAMYDTTQRGLPRAILLPVLICTASQRAVSVCNDYNWKSMSDRENISCPVMLFLSATTISSLYFRIKDLFLLLLRYWLRIIILVLKMIFFQSIGFPTQKHRINKIILTPFPCIFNRTVFFLRFSMLHYKCLCMLEKLIWSAHRSVMICLVCQQHGAESVMQYEMFT